MAFRRQAPKQYHQHCDNLAASSYWLTGSGPNPELKNWESGRQSPHFCDHFDKKLGFGKDRASSFRAWCYVVTHYHPA